MRLANLLLAVVLLTHAIALSTATDSDQAQVQSNGGKYLRALKAHQEDATNGAEERALDFSGLLKEFQKAIPGTSAYKSAAATKKAKAALRKANEDKLFQRMVNGEADDQLFKMFRHWDDKGWSKSTVSEYPYRSEVAADKISMRYFDWRLIARSNVAKAK